MVGSLVAGVDSSTQATKVVIVDPDDGQIVAQGQAAHVVTGTNGARETDPREWWSALRDALGGHRPGGRGRGDRHRRPATRPGRPRRGRRAAPRRDPVERHATRRGRRATHEVARRRTMGDADGSATGRLLHGVQVGLAPPDGARACSVCRGGPAAARLPDRTPDRSRDDRSRGRLGYGLVVARRPASTSPRSWSCAGVELPPERLPTIVGPNEVAGTVTAGAAAELRPAAGNRGRSRHRRQHGGRAWPGAIGRAGGHEPRHVGHDLRRLRTPGRRSRRASWPGLPTPPDGSCRWPPR